MADSQAEGGAKNVSALQESIERGGANSYYYAWKGKQPDDPRFHPRKLGDVSVEECQPERFLAINKYSWQDGKKCVRVYFEIDGLSNVEDPYAHVQCQFDTRSVDFFARNIGVGSFKFRIDELHREIDPAQSKMQVRGNMIILSLSKPSDGVELSWSKLSRN